MTYYVFEMEVPIVRNVYDLRSNFFHQLRNRARNFSLFIGIKLGRKIIEEMYLVSPENLVGPNTLFSDFLHDFLIKNVWRTARDY